MINKKLLLPLAILLILVGFGSVLAVTITTFSSGWQAENLSFTGNQNVTRTLEINRFAIVNHATLNLSGFMSSSLVNGTFNWTTHINGVTNGIWSEPMVKDNKIFISTQDNITILDVNGSFICSSNTNNIINAYPVITNSDIYVICNGIRGGIAVDTISDLDSSNCNVKWDKDLPFSHMAVAIDADGNLTFGLSNGTLMYFNSSGNMSWGTKILGNTDWSFPAIEDDRIYISAGTLTECVNKTQGGKIWNFTKKNTCYSSVIVDEGVYQSCGKNLYALNKTDGTLWWNYTSTSLIDHYLVGDTERIYITITGFNDYIKAINITDGNELWSRNLNGMGDFRNFPTITTDGIWVSTHTANGIYLLNKETGNTLYRIEDGVNYGSISIANNKIIGLNSSYDVNTYSIYTNICEDNWTKPRGHNNNTGEQVCVLSNQKIFNPSLEIGTPDGTPEWRYPGFFTQINNITSDLSIVLNNTLDYGNCTLGTRHRENCSIDFLFHSDKAGLLEYSDLIINWTAPYISSCAGGNVTFNITKWKEPDKSKMNGTLKATFTILGVNYTFNLDSHHEDLFCITPGYSEVKTDAVIEYTNDSYVVRTYYLNNVTISNETQHIPLFLLDSASSRSVIIEALDENYDNIQNIFVKLQRLYIGSNTWETIEMGKTDSQGKVILHVVEEDVFYRLIFEKIGGEVLYTTEPMKFSCLPAYEECKQTFQISGELIDPFETLPNLYGVSYSLTYNDTTKLIKFTWSDSTGSTQKGRLLALQQNSTGTNTICDKTTISSSATIICDISAYNGTINYYAYIWRSPGKLISWGTTTIISSLNIFGQEGVLWAFFIIILIFLAFAWNPVVAIIASALGFGALTIIGFINLGFEVVLAVFILAALLIWKMRS